MKKTLLFLLSILVVAACKPKDPTPEEELTAIEMLTGDGTKNWLLTKAVGLGDEGSEVDLISNRPCLKDNLLIMRSNGTYTLEDTGEVCSDITTVNDNWSLTESPLNLKLGSITLLDRTFDNIILEVTELSKNVIEGKVGNIPENPLGMNGLILKFDAE